MTPVTLSTFSGNVAPCTSIPPLAMTFGGHSQFQSVLRRPRYASQAALEAEPELTPHRAFEVLVSAVCYLSLSPARKPADALEAVQLLHDLADELRWDGLQLGMQPEEAEDRIWQNKQAKWERQCYVEAASCSAKVRSRSRHCSQSLLKV